MNFGHDKTQNCIDIFILIQVLKQNKDKLYKIIPQAKFYNSMGASWRPFSMYGQFSNIRSKYCNTDTNGFRFNKNIFPQKKISIFDCRNTAKKKEVLLLGTQLLLGRV